MSSNKYDELARADFERFMREYNIENGLEIDPKLDKKLVNDTKLDKSNCIVNFIKRLLGGDKHE